MAFNWTKLIPKWGARGKEPEEDFKRTGWQPGMRPPADFFNWQMNTAGEWMEEAQGFIDVLKEETDRLSEQQGHSDSVRWEDVTGKPSTFPPDSHTHPNYLTTGGKAYDSGRLAGRLASEYLLATGKAANSDKLDGVDSSGFMRSNMGNGTLANDLGVAKELRWKNYGQNHTIFDASNSRTPTGRSCNNTNPEQLWSSTFPTLMGWNGSQTYGVRVDSARNADLVAGRNLASEMDSLKQLSVNGKQAHINRINALLGYNSGLTTNNSWNDILWHWEHNVLSKRELVSISQITLNGATWKDHTFNVQCSSSYTGWSTPLSNMYAVIIDKKVIPITTGSGVLAATEVTIGQNVFSVRIDTDSFSSTIYFLYQRGNISNWTTIPVSAKVLKL